MRTIRRFYLALLLFSVLVAADAAQAAIVNWNVAGGGSWNTGANWDTTTIPTSADVASFGVILPAGPTTVNLDGDQTVLGVTIGPGSGKALTIASGVPATSKIVLLSTDTTTDFALSATNGGAHNIAAPIQLGNGSSGSFTATFNSFVNASNFVINGAVTESAGQTWGVRIVGNSFGIVNFATTAKTYSGDTTIATNGILKDNTSDMIPDGAGKGNVVIEGAGQLQLNNTNETINALISSSTTAQVVKSGSNTRTLTIGSNGASGTYDGTLTFSGGSSSVAKIGGGTQTFTGNATLAGVASVSGGTLVVNGSWSQGVNVNTGGTLKGTGTLGTTTTVNGGTLAPGTSVGTMNLTNLTINANGVLAFELNGANLAIGGATNDLLNLTGNLTLNGTLNVTETVANSFLSASAGNQWRLINYTGTLTDNILDVGAMPALQPGLAFQIVASAGQVNLLVVNNVPEPRAFLFFGLTCGMLGISYLGRRWRARATLETVRAGSGSN